MYKKFKTIQATAEKLGTVTGVTVTNRDQYYGDSIKITGKTEDGRAFRMEVTVTDKESADE